VVERQGEAGPGREEAEDSDGAGSSREGKEDNERKDWDGERVQADVPVSPPSSPSAFSFPFVVSRAPHPRPSIGRTKQKRLNTLLSSGLGRTYRERGAGSMAIVWARTPASTSTLRVYNR